MTMQERSTRRQLSPLAEACLHSLGQYTFLTAEQCQFTVNSISITRVRRELKDLSSLCLAGVLRQRRLSGRKFVYYLTKTGASILSDLTRMPMDTFSYKSERLVSYSTDYEHRCLTVSAHIAIATALRETVIPLPGDTNKEVKLTIESWHTYFNKEGANRNAKATSKPLRTKSRIDLSDGTTLIPDVCFVLKDKENPNARFLAVLEVTRGQDVGRVMRQIESHMKAMMAGLLPDRYGIPARYGVLFLCEEASIIPVIQKHFRALRNAQSFLSEFLFASLQDFLASPLDSWRTAQYPDTCISFITGEVPMPCKNSTGPRPSPEQCPGE